MYVCIHAFMRLIIMKMKMKMKKISHLGLEMDTNIVDLKVSQYDDAYMY